MMINQWSILYDLNGAGGKKVGRSGVFPAGWSGSMCEDDNKLPVLTGQS